MQPTIDFDTPDPIDITLSKIVGSIKTLASEGKKLLQEFSTHGDIPERQQEEVVSLLASIEKEFPGHTIPDLQEFIIQKSSVPWKLILKHFSPLIQSDSLRPVIVHSDEIYTCNSLISVTRKILSTILFCDEKRKSGISISLFHENVLSRYQKDNRFAGLEFLSNQSGNSRSLSNELGKPPVKPNLSDVALPAATIEVFSAQKLKAIFSQLNEKLEWLMTASERELDQSLTEVYRHSSEEFTTKHNATLTSSSEKTRYFPIYFEYFKIDFQNRIVRLFSEALSRYAQPGKPNLLFDTTYNPERFIDQNNIHFLKSVSITNQPLVKVLSSLIEVTQSNILQLTQSELQKEGLLLTYFNQRAVMTQHRNYMMVEQLKHEELSRPLINFLFYSFINMGSNTENKLFLDFLKLAQTCMIRKAI